MFSQNRIVKLYNLCILYFYEDPLRSAHGCCSEFKSTVYRIKGHWRMDPSGTYPRVCEIVGE